jgi:hypothetical protein
MFKLLLLLTSALISYSANAQSNEVTIIIKHPLFANETAQVSINDEQPIVMETVFGAGEMVEISKKVNSGLVKIETSHWKRSNSNYINKFEVQSGKTYTVVMYTMANQIMDVIFSTMQDGLIKNIEPEKTTYGNWTVKNQVINVK